MKRAEFQDCSFKLYGGDNRFHLIGTITIEANLLRVALGNEVVLDAAELENGVLIEENWGSVHYDSASRFRGELDVLTIQFKAREAHGDVILIDRKTGKARAAFDRINVCPNLIFEQSSTAGALRGYNLLSIETALY